MFDPEISIAGRRQFLEVYRFHIAEPGTRPAPFNQSVQRFFSTFGFDKDTAIGKVLYKPCNAETPGLMGSIPSEANTLHSSAYLDPVQKPVFHAYNLVILMIICARQIRLPMFLFIDFINYFHETIFKVYYSRH